MKVRWFKLSTLAIGLLLLVNTLSCSQSLSECDSSNAKETLERAFNDSQFARAMYLSVVDISGARERFSSPERKECTAYVLMNNAREVQVEYEMDLKENGKYILTFEIVGGVDSLLNDR